MLRFDNFPTNHASTKLNQAAPLQFTGHDWLTVFLCLEASSAAINDEMLGVVGDAHAEHQQSGAAHCTLHR